MPPRQSDPIIIAAKRALSRERKSAGKKDAAEQYYEALIQVQAYAAKHKIPMRLLMLVVLERWARQKMLVIPKADGAAARLGES